MQRGRKRGCGKKTLLVKRITAVLIARNNLHRVATHRRLVGRNIAGPEHLSTTASLRAHGERTPRPVIATTCQCTNPKRGVGPKAARLPLLVLSTMALPCDHVGSNYSTLNVQTGTHTSEQPALALKKLLIVTAMAIINDEVVAACLNV